MYTNYFLRTEIAILKWHVPIEIEQGYKDNFSRRPLGERVFEVILFIRETSFQHLP